MSLHITSRFDSGAIDVVDATHPDDVRLRIRGDSAADFAQWFHFRVSGVRDVAARYTFENAGQSAYPGGWEGYTVAASYDTRDWFRVETTHYDGQALVMHHTAAHDVVYYAYFEPYGEARRQALVGEMQASGKAVASDIGRSCEGRPMTVLTFGTAAAAASATRTAAPAKARIWIIARQHPGETMAEWFVEGMARRLAGLGEWAGDPIGRLLRERAEIRLVPNMNPDGSALGNLRTNAAGANLNREWMAPDATRSPEVVAVRAAIAASGVDLFFDIHGDEVLPYNFVAGSEMLPDFTAAQRQTQDRFIALFKAASPEFQDVHGYSNDRYQEDALTLASKYIAHHYGCLSLTLEMPFKDNADQPEPRTGWNGARSAALGAAMCQAIYQHLCATHGRETA
ncbi:M14-type cytosolic carboxypeptidase [Robbsia sp. Bb-Pol-6]|uniref:M14-type cytosolic carboxypeptidase n=1 Tax=Robbsia betulipollinis TaxID=2981849 RepID=A0ABT3ZND7_9BURK|nr:M14-type cytosolic carboxypeptidase [Robbsia betulipollinis]MCY0387765.1 M14-type cytosolic carboxypeptidase [Robbsia betulipollinis]